MNRKNFQNGLMRRKNRLSTISSDIMNEEGAGGGGTESFYRRRKSSNFEMLNDPFKYQDMVKQFLDEVEEEEGKMIDGNRSNRVRKRTRSSNYFKCPPIPNRLADINEEFEDYHN